MSAPAEPPHAQPDTTDVLTLVARALADGGPEAVETAVAALAAAISDGGVLLRGVDTKRSLISSSGDTAGHYRLDLPLRSRQALVGMLSAVSHEPLAADVQRLLPAVADVLAVALHLQTAYELYERSLVDAEADRAELAHDLHEGLAQTVVAARHAVSVNAPASTVAAVLARAAREGRRAVGLQRPRAVEGDLDRALRGLASDLSATGTPVVVDVPTLPDLPPALATLAYRVVTASIREEIGTIRVQVRLVRAERLLVTLTGMVDAMDAGAAARWRRRVQAAGGSLEVAENAVRLELPLPGERAADRGASVATLAVRR